MNTSDTDTFPSDFDLSRSRILFIGLLCFFLLDYARLAQFVPILGLLKLNTLIPLTVFFFSIFLTESIKNSEILKHTNSRWLFFFLTLLAISVFTSDVTLYSWRIFKGILGYLFIYFAIRKLVISEHRVSVLFLTLGIVHIIVAMSNPEVILNPQTRSYLNNSGFLGDGNDFALSICLVIPFAIFLFLESKTFFKKVLITILLLALIMCVIGTSSRGASLALIAVLGFLWFKSRKKFFGLILLSVVMVLTVIYAPPEYFNRMESLRDYQNEGSAQGRLIAWGAAIRMANDHPFLGVGTGHFAVKFGVEYRPENTARNETPWLTAHSIYFLALGELGYPGLICLLAILGSNYLANNRLIKRLRIHDYNKVRHHIRLLNCMNASFVAFAVGGAFLSALYYPHLYFLAAISGCCQFLSNRELVQLNAPYNKEYYAE